MPRPRGTRNQNRPVKDYDASYELINFHLRENYFSKRPPQDKVFFEKWLNKPIINAKTQIDKYQEFINYCIKIINKTHSWPMLEKDEKKYNKLFDPKNKREIHHIEPKFEKNPNPDLPKNRILLASQEHLLAHIIRFQVLKQWGDFTSVIYRISKNSAITASERSSIIAEQNKLRKILFWDPEWQLKQTLKGGKKGGLANTKSQFDARKKVGLTFKNSSKKMKESVLKFLKGYSKWQHIETGQIVEIQKDICKDFRTLANILAKAENKEDKYPTDGFRKVAKGKLKSSYKWKLVENTFFSD